MKPDKPKIGSIRSSVSIELQLMTDEQLVDEAKARMAKMPSRRYYSREIKVPSRVSCLVASDLQHRQAAATVQTVP